jgi:hypothetical protein
MLRRASDWLKALGQRLPESWWDRPDLQLPALVASLVVHLVILLIFGTLGYAVAPEVSRAFQAEVALGDLPDESRLETTELIDDESDTTLAEVGGTFAPEVSALITPPPMVEDTPPLVVEAPSTSQLILPTATRLDTVVSVRGSGMDYAEGIDAAVDRIAQEILRKLEQDRTLVVWAFDASGSLQAERENLRKHIDAVYNHINQAGGSEPFQTGGLLTAVVSFGKDRKILTEPTPEPAVVSSAIGSVGLDESGVETVFQTVLDIVKKYGRYRADGELYRAMIIVVTDEIGDDAEKLEPAIAACRSAQVPVYVLGSPAVFGRQDGLADYRDPKTGRFHANLKVDQGPESAMLEGVRLPFWFSGPQYAFLDSGFGPYALSRLAGATGGIYFLSRTNAKVPIRFDPAGMREYHPDWVSLEQYRKAIANNPVRKAVVLASEICQQNLPGSPRLSFPPVDDPAFKEDLTRFQEGAARALFTVEEALIPINQAARFRDKETSRRWQAHYDLIRGRLLALKVRCAEYTGQCARMKRETPKFTKPDSNAWRLVPDKQVQYSDKAAEAAQEAEALLRKVVADHPGTPWALLAQREIQHPMGLKWVETRVTPPPRPTPAEAAAIAKKKAMTKNAPAKKEELPKL